MADRTHYITIHEFDGNGRRELVVNQYLTESEYTELYQYFMECSDEQPESRVQYQSGTMYINLFNTKEQLEDSLLPDGCIIYTDHFTTGEHLITLGER